MQDSKMYLTPGDWGLLSSVAFGGVLLYLFGVVYGIMGGGDRFIHFVAPGDLEFQLDWSGKYVIYQEFTQTPDSHGEIRPGGIEGLEAKLQSVSTGETIALTPPASLRRFNMQKLLAESVYEFEAPQPGAYRFVSHWGDNKETTPIQLLLIPTPTGHALRALVLGAGSMALLALLLVVAAYAMNRRRARQFAAQVVNT